MATEFQKLIWARTEKAAFISIEDFNNLKSQAEQENELDTLTFSLRKFVRLAPDQKNDGFFRVNLFGKVSNPQTSWMGYLSTGPYFLYQLKCVKYFGFDLVDIFHNDKESEKPSFLIIVFGFILAIYIRFPIGIILTLVNLFIVLFASKKENKL